jgi:DNA-binding MarR family transcriptional regulator
MVGFARLADRALGQVGMTIMQYRILSFTAQTETVQSDLAFYLAVSKQNMTRLVDGLVDQRYIVRRVDLIDRRRVLHEVTPVGKDALRRADAELQRSLRMVLQDLTGDELEAVESGLHLFRRAAAKSMDRVTTEGITHGRLAHLLGTSSSSDGPAVSRGAARSADEHPPRTVQSPAPT